MSTHIHQHSKIVWLHMCRFTLSYESRHVHPHGRHMHRTHAALRTVLTDPGQCTVPTAAAPVPSMLPAAWPLTTWASLASTSPSDSGGQLPAALPCPVLAAWPPQSPLVSLDPRVPCRQEQ